MRSFMNTVRGQTVEQMYVFSVLAMMLCFLVKYLTHEAANETMIAVLNTAIGGVTGMLGMAVAKVFGTAGAANARASDAGGGLSASIGISSSTVKTDTVATTETPGGKP